MEGILMREPLDQNNPNNTVDGGIPLESGRDVQRNLSPTITKFKSLMKGEELSRGSPTSSYGSLSLCGRRRKMEDTLTISPSFMLSDHEGENLMVLDFFAVYDGHAGASAADVCKEKLHFLLFNEIQESLKEGDEVDWKKVFGNSFGKLDEEVDEDMRSIGCTALVALVSLNEIIVANCGESKAVLCRQGEVVRLSHDHKLERPDELEREATAGRVLATSQSVGDQHLTSISVPEVSITARSKTDEFIILATNGLWDVMTDEMACYIVRKCLQAEHISSLSSSDGENSDGENGATQAAALLVELAMAKESKDNISVVVIELNKV